MHPTYLVETHELVGSVVVSGVEGGAVERNRTVKDENGKELPGDNTMSLEWNTWHRAGIYNSSRKAAKSRGWPLEASLHTCLALRKSA